MDSVLTAFSSTETIARIHVCDRDYEKYYGGPYEHHVAHGFSSRLKLLFSPEVGRGDQHGSPQLHTTNLDPLAALDFVGNDRHRSTLVLLQFPMHNPQKAQVKNASSDHAEYK
jgi:hypothetical protein